MHFPNGVSGVHAPPCAAAERNSDQEYATGLMAAAVALVLQMIRETVILRIVVSVSNTMRGLLVARLKISVGQTDSQTTISLYFCLFIICYQLAQRLFGISSSMTRLFRQHFT